ncbi:hypothetical protein D1007_35960 [Hordeum vulgare]|nr:hypothetical protein D1007_35960 [Hordeum vulgare]
MFQSLERITSRALSDICGKSVSSPLVPDDAGYLGFFLRVVERLEVGSAKALALAKERTRDLLSQAASDVFSHLLRLDPDFDFTVVLDPVPKTIHAALAEWVEVHVEDLVARLAPKGAGPAHFPTAVRFDALHGAGPRRSWHRPEPQDDTRGGEWPSERYDS